MKHFINHAFICMLSLIYSNVLIAQNPNWQPPISSNYAYTSSIIAKLSWSDVESNHASDRIAVFAGNELRGLSKAVSIGNGQYLHFITVYGHIASESMQIRVFHHQTNLVYEVNTLFHFIAQNISGSIANPFPVKIYPDNNAPLSLAVVPAQTTLHSIPFHAINMADYLIQPDSFPVDWSIVPNPNLISFFNGSILYVSGVNGFIGQTSLTVRATELNSNTLEGSHFSADRNQSATQVAETTILYTVYPLLNAPLWQPVIPNQSIVKGDTFAIEHLENYENQYNGPFIQYDYRPVIENTNPSQPRPSWSMSENYGTNMTVVASLDYTPRFHFNQKQDLLAAFVNNSLRGITVPDSSTGLFFLTVGGSSLENEMVELRLYSDTMNQILYKSKAFVFEPFKKIGLVDAPLHLDFAPIVPVLPTFPVSNGMALLKLEIRDSSFVGTAAFEFQAKDPDYPQYLHDETIASYCIVQDSSQFITLFQDADGDGLGNPSVFIRTCLGLIGYVSNDDDCDDTSAVDPSVSITATENSGAYPDDNHICSGATVSMTASEGTNYAWFNGSTTAGITVNPAMSTTYKVTVTHATGCKGVGSTTITVEGTVVKNSGDYGNGTLRNVYSCLTEGDTITFDLPTINISELTAPIDITKNVIILGTNTMHPEISVNFNLTSRGFNIAANKTMTLSYTDLKTINANNKKIFTGPGTVVINGYTKVRKL